MSGLLNYSLLSTWKVIILSSSIISPYCFFHLSFLYSLHPGFIVFSHLLFFQPISERESAAHNNFLFPLSVENENISSKLVESIKASRSPGLLGRRTNFILR